MLANQLQEFWDIKKFATSWIIGTRDLDNALLNIKNFAQKITNIPGLSIDNNPDFRVVIRDDTKYISVDQIRDLQQFLYTTSTVGEYKFAVIYEADLMNNNSANCCLKILEEPPRQSYLFLLTSEPGSLSNTIKSRCHKLSLFDKYKPSIDKSYGDFVASLLDINISQKIKYLNDMNTKAKADNWDSFCKNSLELLSKMLRYRIDPQIELSSEEANYHKNYSLKYSNNSLLQRFEKLELLIKDTYDFDLDKRQMGILIIECLI